MLNQALAEVFQQVIAMALRTLKFYRFTFMSHD